MKAKETLKELQSWDEVDRVLQETLESEIAITEIEAMMNLTINEAKEKATLLSKPLKEKIKNNTTLIKSYTEAYRSELDGKSKRLNFGKVGFRQSSSVTVPKAKLDSVLKMLKALDMFDCINTKETINIEVLEKYPEEEILKTGATKTTKDNFYLETDKEKIR